VEVTVVRGNAGEIATLVGIEAEVRGVESIAAGGEPAELARDAARTLGRVVAVTGPVDHVSDGERVLAVANGHELLGAVSGTGCMATAITGSFLAVRYDAPLEAAAEALAAFGVAGEDAAVGAKGPGSFHVALYDALYGLDPEGLDARARISET
jgi:hydroxyethylthiazole kinase